MYERNLIMIVFKNQVAQENDWILGYFLPKQNCYIFTYKAA
jgi:hypothetical protein